MDNLNILSKAQINQVESFSQKVALHRPNSITKAMYGLFKYNRNRAWFARALYPHFTKDYFGPDSTRGEFNNARARRALVDWYLSLFVMCKAWHQYNERLKALGLLNSPPISIHGCSIAYLGKQSGTCGQLGRSGKVWLNRLSPTSVGYRKSDRLLFLNMFKNSS